MKKGVFLAAVLCSIPLYATATVVDPNTNFETQDLFAPGDQLLMVDHYTGLAWLKVTATQGWSIDQVLAGAGGYVPAGFRYATAMELHWVFLEFDFDASGGDWYSRGGYGPRLSALLGGVDTDVSPETLNAFAAPFPCQREECESAPYRAYRLRLITYPPGREVNGLYDAIAPLPDGQVSSRYHSADVGSWLVRQQLPPAP